MLALALVAAALAAPTVRVATWNVESLGAPGTAGYEAVADVLERLDADVVGLNEIGSSTDASYLKTLAASLGYTVVVGGNTSFGSDRNAVLSRLPVVGSQVWTAPLLSGDTAANDLTRQAVSVTVDVPDSAQDLRVVVNHWKSGTGDSDELRRVCDSFRMAQAVDDLDPEMDAFVILGDMNEEYDSWTPSPATFSALPAGLPASFKLGSDLRTELSSGLDNDPFLALEALGMEPVLASQASGDEGTRPASGRRLDYLWVSPALASMGWSAQVYDSTEESLAGSLEWAGSALTSTASAAASDHLPVVADFLFEAEVSLLTVDDLVPGDLVVSEVMANPGACSDTYGEWIEVYNASGLDVDLMGLTVQDAEGFSGSIGTSLRVAPEERVVLGRNTSSAWCGGFTPDAFYGYYPALDNTGDQVSLVASGVVVDSTPLWTSANAAAGISWALRESSLSASANDSASAWCAGRTAVGSTSDKGTPGLANDCG